MVSRLASLGALLVMLLGFAPAALALESAAITTRQSQATLVTETDAITPGTPFRAGLRLRQAPGWHSYWQNPGDAGAPTELQFTGLPGLTASPIAWPTPTPHAESGLTTYGYEGEVLLPVTLTATQPGRLSLHATWLICAQICIPEQADFALNLPAGPATPSAEAPLFAAADRATPRPSPWPATLSGATLYLTGPGLSAAAIHKAWFIPARFDTVAASAPQTLTVTDGLLSLTLQTGPAYQPGSPLQGVLVLQDAAGQQTALTISAPFTADTSLPLWQILLMALAGGLVLNLMPCVFPVLALKAVSLAKHAHGPRRAALSGAAFYAAGVLTTFCALGLGLIALRQAGAVVGWGSQFQSPVFVAGMAWVMFAVGLNLSGVYDISFAFSGVGHRISSRGGAIGSFFSGLLAVLVATPCTAPFMGVAVTAALAGTPAITLAIFAAMGLGLAAPYVLIASLPAAARLLPRPGRWMLVLRQLLAFPMYAAALWMLWAISVQLGPPGVAFTSAGLLLIACAAWLFGPSFGRLAHRLAAAPLLGCLAILVSLAATPPPVPLLTAEAGSEPFSPARLAALRAEGRPVFVNMTAAWCITCLVNERVALGTDAVQRAFTAGNVVYLKGDWTRQDASITAYLAAQGRDGVPLYAFYPPNQPTPIIFPQLLTPGIVLAAIGG